MTRFAIAVFVLMGQAAILPAQPTPHSGRENAPARAGFPVDFTASPFGGEVPGGATTVDIDGDGKKEILLGALDGTIHLFRADGREVRDGLWPRHTGGPIVGSVRAGDLDNDGAPEVVAASYDGKLYAFDAKGDRLWLADSRQPGLTSSPVLAGKPGDKSRGVVFSTPDGQVHRLDSGGRREWNYPGHIPVGAPPAVADFEGDGKQHVLIRDDSGIFTLLGDEGQASKSWPKEGYVERRGAAPFTVSDVDGDGVLEVVADQREPLAASRVNRRPGVEMPVVKPGEESVNVWAPTGELASGFAVPSAPPGSVRIGDLDGDGKKELLFPDREGKLHVTGPGGKAAKGFPMALRDLYRQVTDHRIDPMGRPALEKSPALADVDGDGAPEIILCVNDPRQSDELGGMVFALRPDGGVVPGFPKGIGRNHGDLLIADLDDDGDMELVVPGGIGGTARQLHVFDLPASQKVEMILLGSEFRMFKE